MSIRLALRDESMVNDKLLMERCRRGDEKAFEELFQRYSRKIYSIAYGITLDEQNAEDILQETFLRAYEHIIGHRKVSRFYPWLCRVAVNLAVDHHRASRPQEPIEAAEEDIMISDNPESALENKELGKHISAAIADLPLRQREVFALRNLEGLSHKDIAVILGCSQDTVRANLYQAVKKLREKLRKYLAQEAPTKDEM